MVRAFPRKPLHHSKKCIAAIIVSLLSGCANLKQPGEFTEEELKLSQYATLTSANAVQKLEEDFRSTEKTELNVFAPQHYSTAEQALSEAKNLLNQNGSRDLIVQKVAVGEAVLKNADHVVRKVKETLSEELTLKQQLESLNSNQIYASEYGNLVDRLNKVIKSIESGNTTIDQSREKLIKDMQQLEHKARRYNAMNEPEEIIKRVKYSGGETLAPLTYREALEVFVRADEFIKQNPTFSAGIEQVGKEALFAAKRALYITQEVAALGQKFSLSPEQIVLNEEYRMYRVAREISNNDYRDNPLEVQSELLAKAAIEKSNELKSKDDLVIALRDTLIKVRDSSSRLTMLSDTAQQLKEEKGEWLAKEALYKAKMDELAEKLAESQKLLDQTQQTALRVQSENLALSQNLQRVNQQNNPQEQAQTTTAEQTPDIVSPEAPALTAEKSETIETPLTGAELQPEVAATDAIRQAPQQLTPAETPSDTSIITEPNDAGALKIIADTENTNTDNLPNSVESGATVSDNTDTKEIVSAPEKLVETTAEKIEPLKIDSKQEVVVATEPAVNINTDQDRINTAEIANESTTAIQPLKAAPKAKKSDATTKVVSNSKGSTTVTHAETLQALKSAKELLKTVNVEKKPAPKKATTVVKQENSNKKEKSSLKGQAFVDSGE